MTRFLPKNGGLNGWAIIGVLLKTSDKNVIKNCTTENKKNRKFSKKHKKKDVLKTSKSQRYGDYSGFVKSRVGSKSPRAVKTTRHLEPFWLKVIAPRVIFGIPRNPKGL